MPNICLIEDDPIMGESLQDRFVLEGFGVDWFDRASTARQALERGRYDAVISDVRLPDGSGEEIFLHRLEASTAPPPFIFITAYAALDRAVEMLRRGAFDYVTKPLDIGELVQKVRSATGSSAAPPSDPGPLGTSRPMREIEAQLPRIAARARTVLISGESGSGKEVLARRLHELAYPEGNAPFVAVNCGAVPEALLESTFFGHERGAFTGADRTHKGYFEQAQGGTLFLDEIGDLPLALQVKLLRVLQEHAVQRVGGERRFEVSLRVLCATHADLRSAVTAGRFREDLYYRVNVVQLRVPPLRERPDDILWLAHAILQEQATTHGEPQRQLSPAARAALLTHPWPGNVRELRNRLERACVLSERGLVESADLFDQIDSSSKPREVLLSLEKFISGAEREYLQAALRRFDGRVGATAAALGISRKTLWEKCKRHALKVNE